MEQTVTRRPDPDVLQRFVRDEGLSAAQVGELLGLSRATVYRWLRRYGITATGPVVAMPALAEAWRAGASVAQLAAKTGLPTRAVQERLAAAAVLRLPRRYILIGSPEDPLRPELLRLWYGQREFSAEQVAVLTDTTARQVRYRLYRYRLSRAKPGPPSRLRGRLPAEVLRRMYVDEHLSCPQIARRVGASAERVRELLVAAGITRRASGLAGADGRAPLDAARLQALYVEQGKTLAEIAHELGYLTAAGNPSVRRVRSALERAGWSSRRGANWSTRLNGAAAEVDAAVLRQLYEIEGLTVAQVAHRLGWLTPAGHAAKTYTRSRLLASGVALRGPGPRPR